MIIQNLEIDEVVVPPPLFLVAGFASLPLFSLLVLATWTLENKLNLKFDNQCAKTSRGGLVHWGATFSFSRSYA